MAQYQGRIAKLADKDNNTVVPITNARAVEVSKNRNLEAIVDKVDDMENVAQRVFNNSITPIITPIQTSVQRLDGIEAKANANTTKVNQLEQKQTSDKNELANTLNGVKQNVQTIEGNVTNTTNTVTQHTQQIADLEYSVGEVLPKAEEAVAKVDGILGEKYIDCIAQGKMTQVGKQSDGKVVAIDNSFAKSAMLKGQTLVNLITSQTPIRTGSNYKDYSIGYIKANQKYLAIFNAESSSSLLRCGILKTTGEWNSENLIVTTGLNKVVLTATTDVQVGFRVRYGDSEVSHTLNVSNVRLIEYQDGMENWDIPYFEGMASVKNLVVTSTGKNLISYLPPTVASGMTLTQTDVKSELAISGTCTASNYDYYFARSTPGAVIDTEVTRLLVNAPVGTKFVLSNNLGKECYFGVSRNGSSTITWIAGKVGYEVKAGDINVQAFVRFKQGDTYSGERLKIQLEISPSVTTYEPYKSHITSSTEEIILRSLPNGVCDTLNLVTGEYVQRIGEVVLSGGENWTPSSSVSNTELLRFDLNMGILKGYGKVLLCDKFPYLYIHNLVGGSSTVNQECVSNHSTNESLNLVIRKDRLAPQNIDGFRTWLKANPVTIQYELATPVTKKVKLSNSPFMFKDGHIILSSANDLLPTFTYTATVGIKGQVETLSNVVSNIKIEDGVVAPSPNTLARRNNEGNIYAKDKFIFEDGKAIKVNGERIQWGNTADWHNIHDSQSLPVEKGVWTPRFEGVLGGVCNTYDIQEGIYCRIDKLVHIQLKLSVNDYKVCQGVFCVRGLPFTPGNAHTALSIGVINNLKTTLDNASVNAYIDASTDKIILGFNEIRDGSMHYQFENPQVANPAKPILLIIAGTYMID